VPNGAAGIRLSRRNVLASIPLAAVCLWASGCQKEERAESRLFGLAATGLDEASLQRSQAAAQELGRHLDVLTVYDGFSWGQPLPTALLAAAEAADCTPQLTWEPWEPGAGEQQPAYTAAEIAGGRYDNYVSSWAKQAAAYDRSFQLRFAHEMNGDWYPWSVGSPGGSPADYVAAYRRVRGIFDDAGADRVEWVWNPNVIVNGNVDAISQCYPGDDFVDIVGIDGYNFGNQAGHQWIEPAELFGSTLDLVTKLAPDKPVWITEVGCADIGGDKARWITDFFTWLASTDIRALVWFEVSGTRGEPDWRLTASPATVAAAKSGLASW